MSSAVYIDPEKPVDRAEWDAWAADNNIVFSPSTVGGDCFYADDDRGGVQVVFRRHQITISSFFMSNLAAISVVARKVWERWGGIVHWDPELDRCVRPWAER